MQRQFRALELLKQSDTESPDLDDGVFGGSPRWHDLPMQPPAAVGVDQVSLDDQVLQHVFGLLLVAQHQPPEAVVDGQCLQECQMTNTRSRFKGGSSSNLDMTPVCCSPPGGRRLGWFLICPRTTDSGLELVSYVKLLHGCMECE